MGSIFFYVFFYPFSFTKIHLPCWGIPILLTKIVPQYSHPGYNTCALFILPIAISIVRFYRKKPITLSTVTNKPTGYINRNSNCTTDINSIYKFCFPLLLREVNPVPIRASTIMSWYPPLKSDMFLRLFELL